MNLLNTPRLSALSIATLLSLTGTAFAQNQQAPLPAMAASNARAAANNAKSALERAIANAKNPVVKPHPLLAQPFNPQVGPRLIGMVEQMTAVVVAVVAPNQAPSALAKILQIWPQYTQLDQHFNTQLEHIAAAAHAGKKTPEMQAVETTVAPALEAKGQMLDAELVRLSKMPLAAPDMAALQNLRKALAE